MCINKADVKIVLGCKMAKSQSHDAKTKQMALGYLKTETK
jgi:hypothetical protein